MAKPMSFKLYNDVLPDPDNNNNIIPVTVAECTCGWIRIVQADNKFLYNDNSWNSMILDHNKEVHFNGK